jgi:hypothetical protein
LTLVLAGALGCSRMQAFQVIDASNGAALSGVGVIRESKSDDIFLGSKRSSGRLASTDDDGITTARGLQSNMVHTFIFQKTGYEDAEAIWEPNEADRILLDPPSTVQSNSFIAVSAKGVVRIPMYRAAPETKTRLTSP